MEREPNDYYPTPHNIIEAVISDCPKFNQAVAKGLESLPLPKKHNPRIKIKPFEIRTKKMLMIWLEQRL